MWYARFYPARSMPSARSQGLAKMLGLALVAMSLAVLVGCRQDTPPAGEVAGAGATTGTHSTDGIAVIQVVRDDFGRSVDVPAAPARVVAATPFAVEMLYDLGLPPVARLEVEPEQVRPAAAKELPTVVISHGAGPNLEQLATHRGDLMITSPTFAPFAETVQSQLALPVLIYGIRSVDDVPRVYRDLGTALGRAAEGERLAKDLDAKLAELGGGHREGGPTVFAVFGAGDAFYTILPESYLGSMVQRLGGRLVTQSVEPMREGASMGPFSMEIAVAQQPDIILIARHGGEGDPAADLRRNAAWANLSAVQAGRVHAISEALYVTCPGPTVVEAAAELEKLMYPASFQKDRSHE